MKKSEWQGMTTHQKIGYIRDYYTLHIIAAVLTIAAVGWALNHYIFNPPPSTFVNISFYGQLIPDELRAAISADLTNSLVEEGVNYVVVVDNFFITSDPQFDMAMTQRLVAMVAARELDILVISPGEVYDFIEGGFAQDLRDVFSVNELARFFDMGNAMVSVDNMPAGLQLAYFPYFRDLGQRLWLNFDGWTLIVLTNSERDGAVQAFLNYTLFYYE